MGTFPNPDTQFSSENQPPNRGNKKGNKHIATWIQELLNDEGFEANILDSKIGIKAYKGAPVKAIIEVAIVKAINGDNKWAEWLGKHGWGTKVTHANDPENPLNPSADKSVVDKFVEGLKDDTSNQTKPD